MSFATVQSPLAVPLKQDAAIISLVGLAHASSHFAHLLLPLMFPVFMVEFGLSYSELGLLMSTFFVVSGLGQASAGFVVDRLGARPLLFAAIGIFVLACVLASVVTGYAGLLGVAALAGLGNAPFHPVGFTIMNQRVSAPPAGLCLQRPWPDGQFGLGGGAGIYGVCQQRVALAHGLPGGGADVCGHLAVAVSAA